MYQGKTLKCARCRYPQLTWSEARQSYGQLIRAGFEIAEAKNQAPLCRRCVAKLMRDTAAECR